MTDITAITMPRWGLTMEEGTLTEWLVPLGGEVAAGVDIVEIESTKLAGTVEAPSAGVLRRQTILPGRTIPVGTLLGVIADAGVSEEEIDAFAADFKPPEDDGEAAESLRPQSVEVDGQLLSYLRHGEGAPLLFVHGFGGDAMGWVFVQNELAQHADTIAVDLPGHGASDKSIRKADLGGQAAIVAGFIRALGLGKVHLVGHSMGGGVCLALATAEPDLVASLTLLAPMGLGRDINAQYLEAFVVAQKKRNVEAALRMLFADESLVTRSLVDDVLKYKRLDGVDMALAAIQEAILQDGRQAEVFDVERLDCPLTLIAGEADRIIPPEQVAAQGGRLLDGVGHMPQAEAAAIVADALRSILAAG
ncbi:MULTISPECIES: acetoin dehydrogenase dihydrolipoyllysine-residue acetyltransferase subunit [Sphingobium]|uniref:acetoin dehydrogenase dihydrolipoyllysine-residue acetyltransferase subunit n=1 Tax=Sphingobium TaxID=165695 RepID=UPI00159BFD55|nr:acetoin dehydrogenase dihydrolipoyllysine-residue acetyltransferase subunit [Sphingobium sp. 15-1]